MKILTIVLLLSFSPGLFAQDKIVGRYRNYFGSLIQLNADKTFKYTWNLDLSGSWTKGTWMLTGDTVYLQMIPTYDTLSRIKSGSILPDTLILSIDEIPERLTQTASSPVVLHSSGQNRSDHPEKLLFKKGKLYRIYKGKLVTKKQKGFWTNKKWRPWFFRSEE